MNTLISLIIPTYNRAHLIGETLDSVLAQTYKNWECIIVDDGSTDQTDEVVGAYIKKDPRLKYYHRPEEHLPGGNGARNYGYKMSQGKYIQWFDSDDLMSVDYLESQILSALNNKSEIVVCEFKTFNSHTSESYNITSIERRNLMNDFVLKKIKLCLQVMMFKREVVENINFNEVLKKAQDLDFIYDVLKTNKFKNLFLNKQVLCFLRIHDQRISLKYKQFNIETILSSISVKEKILFNEYSSLNTEDKKKLLYQYTYELRLLLVVFKINNFFYHLNRLKKRSLITPVEYICLTINLSYLAFKINSKRFKKKLAEIYKTSFFNA